MKQWPIERDLSEKVISALRQSPWFKNLDEAAVARISTLAVLSTYEPGESVVTAGGPADSFFLLLKGDVSIEVPRPGGDAVELGRATPPFSFGEIGLLLAKPRTATVSAVTTTWVLSFDATTFTAMFNDIPGFRDNVARGLAARLDSLSELVLPVHSSDDGVPDAATFSLLPTSFIEQQRVVPLKADGNRLTVGFVEDPTPQRLAGVRQQVPGMDLCPVRVSADFLRLALNEHAEVNRTKRAGSRDLPGCGGDAQVLPDRLAALLERVATAGASDLHLTAGRKPSWRVDGDIQVIEDGDVIGREDAWELLGPLMKEHHRAEFADHKDVDFGLTTQSFGRFRVNLYRTQRGVNAAIRQIPWRIQTLDQLGMPQMLKKLTLQPKGLILVTGPTGSGKSTTLAAMVDHVNRTRRCHIVTLEDPIEFVHADEQSVVDQREVGDHAESFRRGLRAAMREDPDVVLLGEIREAEEAALALEVANTGHLVLASVHTNSAVTTVERFIDMFPADTQPQVRSSLADNLRGIVSQVLLKARTGGRVSAVEVLIASPAVANIIREGKTVQLANAMQVGAKSGCQLLNEDLARLVRERRILRDEALTKTLDPSDLGVRLQRPPDAAPST